MKKKKELLDIQLRGEFSLLQRPQLVVGRRFAEPRGDTHTHTHTHHFSEVAMP